ncbi:hypothetical protein PsYK624_095280 [Phanerochaete sordida]|uniref:F-box domain-containing protein n=1 Tax=Phanerochaete sordida TaxID=48140 RepID=A0A9P3LG76_9APHY|nr:hypothetical protein PsYK624_095280 [Phanerochaete sordida]
MALFSRPLPIDIVALIIDYFADDRDTLRACAHVAQAWVYPARVFLFRLLRVSVAQAHDGLAEFRRFLDTPRGARAAGLVVYLRLAGVEPADEYHWEPTIDLFALGDVVSRLPKLDTFMADRVRFAGVPAQGPLPLTAPSVFNLSFARMTTWVHDDLRECLDVLHLFPNAKEIMTDDLSRRMKVTGERYHGELPTKYRKFEHLRLENLLHLAYGPTAPLLNYMLHCMNLRNFTHLTLFHLDVDEIPYLGRFVYAVKDSLHYLYFNTTNTQFVVDQDPDPMVYWPKLNLDKCTALETLAIYVNIDYCPWKPRPPDELYSYWEYVEIIFQGLPACLRRVELALEDREEPEWIEEVLLDVDWPHLQDMLCELPALDKVLFHGYKSCLVDNHYVESLKCPLEDWIQDLLRAQLRRLARKNVLDFIGPRPNRRVPMPA